MSKKVVKKKPWMKFFSLRLNEEDLSHLRWLVSCDSEMQRDFMQEPRKKGQSEDQHLEDWCIARDMLMFNYRIIAMIDKVCPEIAKRARKK